MSSVKDRADSARKRGSALVAILRFLWKYPKRVALCLGLLCANIAIEMSLPQIVGTAVNNLRWHGEWGAEFDLQPFLLLFLALVFVRAGLGHLLGPRRNRLVHRTLNDIRGAIFNAIQRLPFQYHDKASAGELISRSTTDVSRLQEFFFACLFLTVDITLALTLTSALIFAISPALGLVAVGTMLPTVALIAVFAAKLQPQWRKVHDLHGAMTTVVQENIAGVRVVKAFAKEGFEIQKFNTRRAEFLGTLMDTVNYWAARVPFAQFIFGLSLPLALWVGGRQVIAGEIVIGDLVKAALYLLAVGNRVGQVGQFTNIIQNASASAGRILEIIDAPNQLQSGIRALPPQADVTFEDVSFKYPSSEAGISELSFKAEAGKTYALVGPTGAGKSTVVNLIPRFYDPSSGCVRIGGVDARELRLDELRRAIGVIFQETFLFSASIAENISYGRPEATREQIIEAAKVAQIHEFIAGLERGYDTIIGERGVTLSGGQKQRVAIARAYLLNPRILIMDDATASVDAETERLIQEGLRQLRAGRTTFLIAHRATTAMHADQILFLKEGRLVEQGTHEELIRARGAYWQFFQKQLSGEQAEGAR